MAKTATKPKRETGEKAEKTADVSYWLFKTEASTHSWDMQKARGRKGEPWDGVRNFVARNNMKAMQLGDLAFFYHSGEERRIMGTLEVVGTWRPDLTDASGRFGLVDFKAVRALERPVTLAEIKADPRLRHLALVRQSRLSVMPVDAAAWRLICALGGIRP